MFEVTTGNKINFANIHQHNDKSMFFKPFIQPKLTVNEPGDIYEKEADEMADKIMKMTKPEKKRQSFFKPTTSYLQRKCMQCEEKEKQVRRKENSVQAMEENSALESYISGLDNKGLPLSFETRNFFESRFGYDFSNVKVHSNLGATQSAQSINALAYTSGNNIVFNKGQYSPYTDVSKRLLAHELTHVIQQKGGSPYNYNRNKKSIQAFVPRAPKYVLSELCFAPSGWGMSPDTWTTLGIFAHLVSMNDYLSQTGGIRNLDVYLDSFELIPIDPFYVGFIIRNNPGLSVFKEVFLATQRLKRPDYMIHRPGRTEFDELKPDSIDGVLKGIEKISEIAGYMLLLGLPYKLGITYKPRTYIPLLSFLLGGKGGVPVNVYLKFTRLMPGLIVYEICIETDWARVVKATLVALVALILIGGLKGLPVGTPGPLPIPSPLPIPAANVLKQ